MQASCYRQQVTRRKGFHLDKPRWRVGQCVPQVCPGQLVFRKVVLTRVLRF
jgi:hypothetical protein